MKRHSFLIWDGQMSRSICASCLIMAFMLVFFIYDIPKYLYNTTLLPGSKVWSIFFYIIFTFFFYLDTTIFWSIFKSILYPKLRYNEPSYKEVPVYTGSRLQYTNHLITKPTKWHERHAKTQITLGIRPVLSVFAVCSMDSLGPKLPSCGQQRLIRLGGCPGWSESLKGANAILLVLLCASSYNN